ncbi:MAG: NIPSNAP family protein [Gammaproteobacteria bacterium]|nr:NIPSNAP family protein [Gammaproteobacteria bacterium]
MITQLRIYTINRGALNQWVEEWEAQIKPLRIQLGFQILGAWTIEETNQFVWILGYAGPASWDALDQAFHESPERQAMSPNPARHIARIEHHFLTPVSSERGTRS